MMDALRLPAADVDAAGKLVHIAITRHTSGTDAAVGVALFRLFAFDVDRSRFGNCNQKTTRPQFWIDPE